MGELALRPITLFYTLICSVLHIIYLVTVDRPGEKWITPELPSSGEHGRAKYF